jgi:quinol monooxygenase YgiN
MYASIRRYRVSPESMDELLHEVDTGFAENIQEMDGFVGYECVDCGNGTLLTISTFRDQQGAEASAEAAAAWVQETLSDRFDIERLDVFMGEVGVSRAREAMLEPAHH